MRSQLLSTPRIWNTSPPTVRGRARKKLSGGLQPYRRTSVISQGYLTRWIAHLRTSILRPRCWTCLTCRTANLKPSSVTLSSAYGNSKCCLMRLRITLKRSIRQREDIPSPCYPVADDAQCSAPVELATDSESAFIVEGCESRHLSVRWVTAFCGTRRA